MNTKRNRERERERERERMRMRVCKKEREREREREKRKSKRTISLDALCPRKSNRYALLILELTSTIAINASFAQAHDHICINTPHTLERN